MNPAESTVRRALLSPDEQRHWIEDVRAICKESPLVRPHTPNGLPMRVKVTSAGDLGWVGDGAYRYTNRDKSGNPWPPLPPMWRALFVELAGVEPDSAIINWYETGASLGWHRDKSEVDLTLPIVTVSLGDACSWAVKRSENGTASRTKLDSGDVTVFEGESRGWWHTVERIIPAPLLSPLRGVAGRISVTIRRAG